MPITVKLKYLRISPRKVRLVADLVRRKTVNEAENVLEFALKRAVDPIKKLLKSGVATAENDFQLNKSNLYIIIIFIDEAPTLKRWRPRARGRTYPIMKRASHITLVLDEMGVEEKPKLKKQIKTKKVVPITSVKDAKGKGKQEQADIKIKKEDQKLIRQSAEKTRIKRPEFNKVAKRIFRRKSF